ncbi:MAG: malonyl-CoA synthase [Inquilinus sp.]|nr:malonyl-CoA synthase [Inquilinus sp.]
MKESLFATIRARIADGNRVAVRTAAGASVTYGDLLEASGRYASALVALGVRPGDRVAVQVEKSLSTLMLYLGALRAGAVYLPLNTGYTAAELSYFLGDAEARLLVCDPGRYEALAAVAAEAGVGRVETLDAAGHGSIYDRAMAAPPEFEDVPRGADDLAAILYTSGTTGRSKGAMLSHGNLASNALALCEAWRITGDDVLLHALPVFHTHGLFVAINTTLLAGASMIFLPRFDADLVVELLPRATTMMGVPTFYSRLLAHPAFDRALVAHMRLFVSGSAPLSAEVHKAFQARTGHAILERYGMTETNMNTSNPYEGERRPGTVGMPLPGVELRIADPESGRILAQGEVGVIEVRGPNVFLGYWRMPEKTAAEFRADGFFITGDMGLIDAQGYVAIVGRDKDLIITGGFNVYPAEVEAEIDALPGVRESAVIGAPHPDFGEGVTAVIAPDTGAEIDESGVRRALEHHLAKFKVPKRVLFVDQLPRNTMGKIQKNALRDTYRDIYALPGSDR